MPCPCEAGKCGCKEDCLKTGKCSCDTSCNHCNQPTQGCGKEGCKCENCDCPSGTCTCGATSST